MKIIPLTQGKSTIVDDEDYVLLIQWKWRTARHKNKFYAITQPPRDGGKRKSILMHRLLLNAKAGIEVDHKDGDGLNNQRSNIRLCTHAENLRNKDAFKNSTSKYKGVSWFKPTKKWKARIHLDSKEISLGYFDSEIDAAKAYNDRAIILHGEFARLNVIT